MSQIQPQGMTSFLELQGGKFLACFNQKFRSCKSVIFGRDEQRCRSVWASLVLGVSRLDEYNEKMDRDNYYSVVPGCPG